MAQSIYLNLVTNPSGDNSPAVLAANSTLLQATLNVLWRAGAVVVVLLTLALAWMVAGGEMYKAGSRLGYNLGLAGGLMMLALLLYPLRKRVRFMDRLGPMRHWFRLHMIFGIGGPLLILFHSTFRIGSMNARVALYSMLLVAVSGIVGRFVYRHIHRGLYGSRLTLTEAEEALRRSAGELQATFAWAPDFDSRLQEFRNRAFAPASGIDAAWGFVTLRWRGQRLARSLRPEIRTALTRQRCLNAELDSHWHLIEGQLRGYVDATCKAAQFSTWERLFSLWHVVHVPFLYLLLLSGVVHVISVHIY